MLRQSIRESGTTGIFQEGKISENHTPLEIELEQPTRQSLPQSNNSLTLRNYSEC